jgi:hypothetical protein
VLVEYKEPTERRDEGKGGRSIVGVFSKMGCIEEESRWRDVVMIECVSEASILERCRSMGGRGRRASRDCDGFPVGQSGANLCHE